MVQIDEEDFREGKTLRQRRGKQGKEIVSHPKPWGILYKSDRKIANLEKTGREEGGASACKKEEILEPKISSKKGEEGVSLPRT